VSVLYYLWDRELVAVKQSQLEITSGTLFYGVHELNKNAYI
jgi:hypothetical protein